MTDRLAELRRQRALVAEHLAWLDREIAAANPAAPPPPSLSPAVESPAVTATRSEPLPPAPAPQPPASALPESRPADIRRDVRRGCLLYFALAALLVAGGCALLVWVSRTYNSAHTGPAAVETR